jgi:hypothetical protein
VFNFWSLHDGTNEYEKKYTRKEEEEKEIEELLGGNKSSHFFHFNISYINNVNIDVYVTMHAFERTNKQIMWVE